MHVIHSNLTLLYSFSLPKLLRENRAQPMSKHTRKRIIHFSYTLNNNQLQAITKLILTNPQLESITLNCQDYNIDDGILCAFITAVSSLKHIKRLEILGSCEGKQSLFENRSTLVWLTALRGLIAGNESLNIISLVNVIYNLSFIKKLINTAFEYQTKPIFIDVSHIVPGLYFLEQQIQHVGKALDNSLEGANTNHLRQRLSLLQQKREMRSKIDALQTRQQCNTDYPATLAAIPTR